MEYLSGVKGIRRNKPVKLTVKLPTKIKKRYFVKSKF